MEFGWINIFGICIVAIMMIPNVIYARKTANTNTDSADIDNAEADIADNENIKLNMFLNVLEQNGRFLCILLMIVPLVVQEFAFDSKNLFIIYLIGNISLLLAYLIEWIFYFKNKTLIRALVLAIIPTCIFVFNGITLKHWLLVVIAIIFGIGHISSTYQSHRDL